MGGALALIELLGGGGITHEVGSPSSKAPVSDAGGHPGHENWRKVVSLIQAAFQDRALATECT